MDTYSYLNEIGKIRDSVKTESDSPIHKIMKQWSEDAIALMKDNTPKASGRLAASISFDFKNDGGVVIVEFTADDYWDYVNSGVDGFSQSAGAVENKFGNTYSFKSAVPSRSMVDSLLGQDKRNWLASKGITSLTYGGKTYQLTTESDYRGAAFVFARAVKQKGIKPSNFVGKAVNEESISQLENLLMDALENLF